MLKTRRLKEDQTIFGQLRKKLTRINLAVMVLLCLLLVGGTYFVMSAVIFNQSQQLLQIIATGAGSPVSNRNFRHDRHVPRYFYVKTNGSGQIVERSPDIPLNDAQLSVLVNSVEVRPDARGQVSLHDESYTYLKVPLGQNTGQLLAFVSLESDKDTLGVLLLTLSAVGIVYLGLAYVGGRFLAGRAMRPIRESWQRQQDFVADASHELRTPLAVIQTNLELIKGNADETVVSQKKWLDYIDLETKRLSKLVNDLLFLARADSDQQALEVKELFLSTVIRNTVEPFRILADQKGVDLKCSIVEDVLIRGDELKLRQLVVILLDNALKHTACGGEISVELDRIDYGGRIIMSDTGEGIAPEHLPHIFDRFYRIDKARSQQTGGTGLGLAIAKWIAQSHGGMISASSQPGIGTVLTVTLPGVSSQC